MNRYILVLFFFCTAFGLNAQKNLTKPSVEGPGGLRVNSFSGNISYTRQDVYIEGLGQALDVTFNYRNNYRDRDRGFGNGWTLNLDKHYERIDDRIEIEGTSGGKKFYTLNGGSWDAQPGVFDKLVEYGSDQFQLTDKYGTVCYFENPIHRKVTKILDRCGVALTLSYSDTLLAEITDVSNRTIKFDWQDGKLRRVYHNLLADITEHKFEYDGQGNMVKYTNPLGSEIICTYDDDNRLIGTIDENQTPTSIAYQSTGGVKQINSCDVVMSFSYNPLKNETYVVEQVGRETVITTYNFDESGKLTSKSGNCCGYNQEYTYDDNNNISKRVDGNGEAVIYNYDEMGNVVNRIDPIGNSVSREYDPVFSNVTKMTDEAGAVSNYTYDAKGNLLSHTNALGQTITMTYDAFGNMSSKTDRRGFTTTYSYDANGYLSNVTFVDGSTMTFVFSPTGNLISKTDENGHTTTYTFDLLNQMTKETDPLGFETIYTYDGVGNNTGITDPLGNTIQFEYNGLGQLVHRTSAEGIVTSDKYDAVGNIVESTDGRGNVYKAEYNIRNQVLKQIDPLGQEISFDYDGVGNKLEERDKNGNAVTYTYSSNNELLTQTLPNGAVFTFEYDAVGRLLLETDPRGNSIGYTYDALGRKTSETDQLGLTEYYTYDANGNLETVTDRRGNVTTNLYDNRDRLIKKTLPLGQIIEYTYDGVGNRLTLKTAPNSTVTYEYDERNNVSKETSPGGLLTSYTYDDKGRLIRQTFANGNVLNFQYDKDDRLLSESDQEGILNVYTYDANDNRVRTIDADSVIKKYTYDPLDRLVVEEDTRGFKKILEYDPNGRLTRQITPLGEATQITYNNLSLPAEITDPLGAVITLDYDQMGNLKTLTDGKGNISQYTYDQKNREVSIIYPDGKSKVYEYDAKDNITARIERDGVPCTYTYDELDRQITKSYPDGTSCTFTYDVQNRMLTANNSNVNVVFTYNLDGQLLQEQVGSQSIAYVYDETAKTKTITYPNNSVITEELDFRDRPTQLKKGSSTLLDVTYNASRIGQKVYGNGRTINYTFDSDRLLQSIRSDNAIFHVKYQYDANENRTSLENTAQAAQSQIYDYDAKQRLVNYRQGTFNNGTIPTPASNSMYAYDAVGNRTTFDENNTNTSYTTNSINQYTQVIEAGQNRVLQYTQKGDLSSNGVHTYTYDCDSRIQTIDATIEYRYDALGRKYQRISPTNTATYYYYADQVILIENSNAADQEYFYFGDADILVASDNGTALHYYHEDALGNIIGLTDTNGNLVERYNYTAFGAHTIYDASGTLLSASSVGNLFFYNGKELDTYAGIYNYRNRNYDPSLGRFLQKDPIGYRDGMNLYRYVANNPTNFIDSYGLKAEGCFKLETPELVGKLRKIGFLSKLKKTRKKRRSSLDMKVSGETCNKCCSETGQRGQSYDLSVSLTGRYQGELNGLNAIPAGRVFVLVSRFISAKPFVGIKFGIYASGSINYKIDECGNESGGGCLTVGGNFDVEVSYERKGGKGKKPINHDFSSGIGFSANASIKACMFKGDFECTGSYSAVAKAWYDVEIGWIKRAYEISYPIDDGEASCQEIINSIPGL